MWLGQENMTRDLLNVTQEGGVAGNLISEYGYECESTKHGTNEQLACA